MSGAGDWIESYLLEQADAKRTWRKPVRVVATSTQTLSGLPTIDGVALSELDEVLLTADGASNGPWVVSSGAWSRRADFDTSAKALVGALFYVREGTAGAGSWWRLSGPSTIVLNTTSLVVESKAGYITLAIGRTPALSGALRMTAGDAMVWRAGSGDVDGLQCDGSGNIVLGDATDVAKITLKAKDTTGTISYEFGASQRWEFSENQGAGYAQLKGFGTVTALTAENAFTVQALNGIIVLDSIGTGSSVYIEDDGAVRFQTNSTGLAFFGATPVAKPTVTGSRGGNAALASVLTALANLGLITDSSSA